MSMKTAARWRPSRNLVLAMFLTAMAGASVAPVRNEPVLAAPPQADNKTTASLQFLLPSSSSSFSDKKPPGTTVPAPTVQLTTPQQANATEPPQSRPRSATNNRWLESILIHVESLNLNNQNGRPAGLSERRLSADVEPDWTPSDAEAPLHNNITANPFLDSSEAPTDSGEDPLETSTLQEASEIANTLPRVTQSQPNASQYSVGAGSSSTPSLVEGNPQPSSSSSPAEQANGYTTSDDNSQSIESNNVSAVINLPESIADHNQINEQEALRALSATSPPKQPVSCEQAYTQCALRKVCAPALKSYNDDCQDLINNRTNQCSPKCLKAMIALRSSEEGDDLVKCDCQSNEYCLQSKQRSEACRPQVEEAVDPKTLVSCSTASWICLADQLCSTALEFYYRNCQSLFSQRHCSMRCNNSLSILYRQPKAQKLITCQCDGSEEFPCVRYKTYTERLCLNKPVSPHMDAAITLDDSNEAQQATSSEEELSNMTNNPESGFGSSISNNGDTFHDQDDYEEDSKPSSESGAALSEDSSAGFNGIQLMEDNWIPLMSGRYFANLHQRQIAQQQQQQQQQFQHPKRRYHLKNQQHRDQLAPPQQQRKSAKNAKQKTNKTNSSQEIRRSRHNRILMLASSSSSSCPSMRMANMVHGWSTFITVVVYLSFHILFTRFLLH